VVPVDADDIEAIAFSPNERQIVLAVSGHGRESARLEVLDLESSSSRAQASYKLYASAKSVAWCHDAGVIANVELGGVRLYIASNLGALAFLPREYPSHVQFSASGTHIGVGDWGKGFVCPVKEALASGGSDA
jgi:hypothetical protein